MFENKYIQEVGVSIILYSLRLIKSIFIFVPIILFWFIGFSASFNPREMLDMFSLIGNISEEQLSMFGFTYVIFHWMLDTFFYQANHLSYEIAVGAKSDSRLEGKNGNS